MESLYYKLDGNNNPVPATREEACALFNKPQDQIVSRTDLEGVLISTVFLIIDHGLMAGRPPILFETMVFGGPLHHTCLRYATFQEAQAGHDQLVMDALLKSELALN